MKHIRVVAGAVIRGSQVFLCQRRPDQYPPSAWEFPGGKVEPGESDTEALIRELQEELGCDVAVHEHLGTHEHDYPSFRVTLVLFRVSVVGGELVPREHASVAVSYTHLRAHET